MSRLSVQDDQGGDGNRQSLEEEVVSVQEVCSEEFPGLEDEMEDCGGDEMDGYEDEDPVDYDEECWE